MSIRKFWRFLVELCSARQAVPEAKSEAKDYSLDGEDREEWDRRWRAMPNRRLPSPPLIGIPEDMIAQWRIPASVTISQAPPEFYARMYRETECCPVCGASTAGTERLPARLNPHWEELSNLGIGVWVHRTCFERCPDAGEPPGVPW
jgi:hypothetical protein